RVLSRMCHAIVIRTFARSTLETVATHSGLRVSHRRSDDPHACQLPPDQRTILEQRSSLEGKTVSWIGDGNNMCNTYIQAAMQFDFQLRVACPEGYEPDQAWLDRAGDRVTLLRDPREAVAGAHLVCTDVFASMGQEDEAQER